MRIRTIKPEFFKNDALAQLAPITRILFIGLWCMADRRGRLEDRPKRIKAELLPYDDCDIEDSLSALADGGFIVRYTADSICVIQVVSFEKHQRIGGKESEAESSLPAQGPEATVKHSGSNGENSGSNGEAPEKIREATGKHLGLQEGKGKEGKGTELVVSVETPAPQSDDSWLQELQASIAYEGISVRTEYAKMQAWCNTNKKQATRRRFLNWLNRCDRPMRATAQNNIPNAILGAF